MTPRFRQGSGHSMTVNVEYNQLDPLLRATSYPDGDVNDDTGFSPFPGAHAHGAHTVSASWLMSQ